MQIGLPAAILREIISHALGKKDVTGIAAIHHPLRNVDPGAGNVLALVHIDHVMHRPAVNTHSHRQTWFGAQRLTDLQSTFYRVLNRTSEDQGHAVTGGKNNELAGRFCLPRRLSVAHNLIKLLQRFRLLINEQLGITHNVQKEHMRDLQSQLRLLLFGH